VSRVKHPEIVPKPVRWVGTSKEDLSAFPDEVRRRVGRALWDAQIGLKAPFAKPLKGFGGAGVLEVVDDFDISTPKSVLELIAKRLARAHEDYESWRNSHGSR